MVYLPDLSVVAVLMGAMRAAMWSAEMRLTLALATGLPFSFVTEPSMLAMVVPDSVSVRTPAWFSSEQAAKNVVARASALVMWNNLKCIML